jgi:hypothetical protein
VLLAAEVEGECMKPALDVDESAFEDIPKCDEAEV